MKKINEIGNQYGYLTVIDSAPSQNNRAMWLCQCKCGNTIIASGKLLRNGHVKSCGCLKSEKTIERNIERGGGDLTGQRFGKLTVISLKGLVPTNTGHNDRMWECQCDCGNIIDVRHRYLRCGEVSSCGCSNSKGNATIKRWLNQNHFNYQEEYIFKDFISPNGGNYRYDFAIFNDDNSLKCLIEYQGSIHFYADGTGWNTQEALIERQKRDLEKLTYCKNNDIILYYITYKDDIEERLEELLNGRT